MKLDSTGWRIEYDPNYGYMIVRTEEGRTVQLCQSETRLCAEFILKAITKDAE